MVKGGIYIFALFDYYGASGICLLWLCLCECLALGWIYCLAEPGSHEFLCGNASDFILPFGSEVSAYCTLL